MCRMTRPSGNLQRVGVTGRTLTRTVSDLLRSRMPFLIRHNSSRHILREAGQIDEGPEDEHLGTRGVSPDVADRHRWIGQRLVSPRPGPLALLVASQRLVQSETYDSKS